MTNKENIVQKLASETLEFVNNTISDTRKFCIFPDVEPDRSCTALLAASMQHAQTISYLLKNDPITFGASALAIVRPQVETLLRAQFLAYVATADEIDEFIKRDKGIYVRKDGKADEYRSLKQADVIRLVITKIRQNEHVNEAEREKSAQLANDIYEDYERMSSLVHGGARLIGHYRDDGAITHFDMTLSECLDIFRISARMFVAAMIEMCRMSMMIADHRVPLILHTQKNFEKYMSHVKEIVDEWILSQTSRIDTTTKLSQLVRR